MAGSNRFSSPSKQGRRPRFQPPKMLRHAGSRRARARIDGKTIWLGRWEGKNPSPEAIAKFERVLADWFRRRQDSVSTRTPARETTAAEPDVATPLEQPVIGVKPSAQRMSVAELVAQYCDFAETYYRKPDGTHTSSIYLVRRACVALTPFMETPADSFGPLKFTTLLEQMAAEQRVCRKTINDIAKCIRRIFRWGASRQLVPGTVHHALCSAELLKRNRTLAVDYPEVPLVPDEVIQRTLPFLPTMIRDMVVLQRATGARPGEICNLTVGDIDTSGDVWTATLKDHKTAYAGCTREVLLGPAAQVILERYLPRASTAAVFDPREAEKARLRARRAARKTKLYPSHIQRRKDKKKTKPKRTAGLFYTEAAYRRAIQRACRKAGVEKWFPNQIRHTAATEYKNRFGWEIARVVLGQKSVNTTAIYAERDREGAIGAVREIG